MNILYPKIINPGWNFTDMIKFAETYDFRQLRCEKYGRRKPGHPTCYISLERAALAEQIYMQFKLE